ncbi:MAG TPA: aminotransferase class V-fold PLP-dependent enzyme [Candidatus Limnocylindria bacterium]|nr:aminotransferase class V-fold PLP-dependent enzyme [Candidatus Limnocylindria bacterium]
MNDGDAKLRALRELLPATGAGIYLDTATRGPLPAETAAAMGDADDWELRVGRATEGRAEDVAQRLEEARAVLAALLVADPVEITVTHGGGDALSRLARVTDERRLVLVQHVDPNTGALADPKQSAGDGDTLLVLDATLSAGAIPLDVATLGVDAVALSADRWLLGPEMTGALWVGPRFGPVEQPEVGRTALLGLARSVGWLEMYVGLEWAYDRGLNLAQRLHAALSATPGVDVTTAPESMATIVCFQLPAWPVDEALAELRRRVFAVVGPTDDGESIRASVAWFNTDEEIDRFAGVVAEVASHTPDTLPRRPPLVVR